MSRPTMDIVIVNWNAGAALREALRSIEQSRCSGFDLLQVVVVDNASSDGSAESLAISALPLRVIFNPENRGFAAACNQGAQDSQADYVLFLNPDTRLMPDTLAKTIAWMSRPEAASVGIAGVQLIDDSGRIARTCARFPQPSMFLVKMLGLGTVLRHYVPDHFYSEWDHTETRVVDQVMGAYFFVRNSLFRQLGGLDERFFVYFEEVDFSLRAKRAGWNTCFLAGIECYHKGCGTTDQIKARRLYYSLQSRILYGFKHWSKGNAIGMLLATLLLEPVARATQALLRGSGNSVLEVVHGYRLLWSSLPRVLRTARLGLRAGTNGTVNQKEVPGRASQEPSLTGAQPEPGGVVSTTHPGSVA